MATYLWKSLSRGLNSYYGKKKWKIGEWYKCKEELRMCSIGLHASERIIDAMQYVPMECLAKVEVRGKHIEQDDKQCWQEMRIIKAWKWTKKDSVALAIYAAELVIGNFEKEYPDDKRPQEAIKAARKWLENPTEKNRSAARSAAESTRSAARSAWFAAKSARSAAGSAAESTWFAAKSAGSAARSAWFAVKSARSAAESEKILKKCERWIQKLVQQLDEII